jgi:hypothetical protein
MRCVARALPLAAILLVAGCNLFHNSDVQVARIMYVEAPDTVRADAAFEATVGVLLGLHTGYVLDRFEVSSDGERLTVQAWSHDAGDGFDDRTPADIRLKVGASPAEQGMFRITAIQPDKRETLKTITVLP